LWCCVLFSPNLAPGRVIGGHCRLKIAEHAADENALKELIKKKQHGEKIEKPRAHPQAQVINLMEALRQSAAAESGGARSHPRRAPTRHRRTPANRSNARPRKAS
jgi:DNA end-binding protein Ku